MTLKERCTERYDAPSGILAAEAGVDVLLVGDSVPLLLLASLKK